MGPAGEHYTERQREYSDLGLCAFSLDWKKTEHKEEY